MFNSSGSHMALYSNNNIYIGSFYNEKQSKYHKIKNCIRFDELKGCNNQASKIKWHPYSPNHIAILDN